MDSTNLANFISSHLFMTETPYIIKAAGFSTIYGEGLTGLMNELTIRGFKLFLEKDGLIIYPLLSKKINNTIL